MPNEKKRVGPTDGDDSEAEDSLQLVDDHYPKPMANMKPTEKNPTAADKFDKHQSDYESRENTKDRINEVHQHNSGYPKLRDELDRRRSCTRVQTENKERNRRISHRSKQRRNPRRKTKRNDFRSRVVKNKKKRDKKSKLHRAVVYSKEKGDVCDICGRRYLNKEFIRRCPTASAELVIRESHHSAGTLSNVSRIYPEPSEPSVSSYHSFFSTDHEPME